jgi:hypothetical protein
MSRPDAKALRHFPVGLVSNAVPKQFRAGTDRSRYWAGQRRFSGEVTWHLYTTS